MRISFFMPVVSGSCWIFSSSSPAITAAVTSVSAEPAPAVMYAAGTSTMSAIACPAFSSSSISGR